MPVVRTTRTMSIGLTTGLVAAAAATLLAASPAAASGHSLLREDLVGVFPLSDPVNHSPIIAGVKPGGAPWVIDDDSEVRVREDGRITVDLDHLVIPGRTPGNPIPRMAASLVCDDMVVSSTDPFDVDEDGNGKTHDHIWVPDDCDDPIVLIRNAADPAALGAYFAVAMDD
jgi:hypothetical protein